MQNKDQRRRIGAVKLSFRFVGIRSIPIRRSIVVPAARRDKRTGAVSQLLVPVSA